MLKLQKNLWIFCNNFCKINLNGGGQMEKNYDLYNYDLTELTHSFQDACAKEEFKDFVYGLNIKEEVLMRYTSSLEEACSEHLACLNCKGLDKCPNRLKGYKYTPMLDKSIITFSYDMCSNKVKQDKEDAYKKNLDLFDMPKDIKDATFIGMYKDDKNRLPIIKYFKEFMDNYNNEEKPKGIRMNGRGVYTFVAKILPHYVENLVEKSGMKADDIDYLIPHQANIRIIQAVQERLGYPDEKVVTNIKYYGNTSAASIPIALAESVEKGKVKLGTTAILCGFGAGMTWGGAIVRLREGIC